MELFSPISFIILFFVVKLFYIIKKSSYCDITFPDYRRQICKRPKVKEHEEKLERSSVTDLLRFSMSRRQDEIKEETWRNEH